MAYIGHLAKSFPETRWERSNEEISLKSAVDYMCRLNRVQGDCIFLSKNEIEPFVRILREKGFQPIAKDGYYLLYKKIEGLIVERFICQSEEDDCGYIRFDLKVGREDQLKFD